MYIGVKDNNYVKHGSWDSIHVVEVQEDEGASKAKYTLVTTVLLNMVVEKQDVGLTDMSGTLSRKVEVFFPFLLYLTCLFTFRLVGWRWVFRVNQLRW